MRPALAIDVPTCSLQLLDVHATVLHNFHLDQQFPVAASPASPRWRCRCRSPRRRSTAGRHSQPTCRRAYRSSRCHKQRRAVQSHLEQHVQLFCLWRMASWTSYSCATLCRSPSWGSRVAHHRIRGISTWCSWLKHHSFIACRVPANAVPCGRRAHVHARHNRQVLRELCILAAGRAHVLRWPGRQSFCVRRRPLRAVVCATGSNPAAAAHAHALSASYDPAWQEGGHVWHR